MMTNSNPSPTLTTESDYDLVAAIALQDDDKDFALIGLAGLHARYSPVCLGIARMQNYSGIDPDTVVSKTFTAIWKAAKNFDPEKRNKAASRENAVKAWIFRILRNEIISEIRDMTARNEIAIWEAFQDENEEINRSAKSSEDGRLEPPLTRSTCEEDDAAMMPQPGHMDLLNELMKSLSSKEQMILDLSAQYIDPNPPFTCHIPKDHLAHLAAQIGVAPSSIKVLRQRAYEKLRKLAQSHNNPPQNTSYEK